MGSDASGLELRMLAHYMNDEEYTDAIVNGKSSDGTDIHTLNMKLAGLDSRDQAKSMIYCHNYGGGNKKLGETIGGSTKDGKALRETLMREVPKLAELITNVQLQASTGFLRGLDGRRLVMRKQYGDILTHKALNTLLQGAGAVVMKYADILLDTWVSELDLRAYQVISYHDETQWEVHKDDVELFLILCGHWVRHAGILLEMSCPLASDGQVGNNWSETH